MKRGKMKALIMALVGAMMVSWTPNVSYAATFETPIDAVKALTEENREKINKIEPQGSFVVDPAIFDEQSETVKVIVELKGPSIAEIVDSGVEGRRLYTEQDTTGHKETIENQHKDFKEKINAILKQKKINHLNELDQIDESNELEDTDELKVLDEYYYTLNGLAMEIPKSEIETLLETGVVKRIWKDAIVQAPEPVEIEESEKTEGLPAPLSYLGVDKLHGEDIKGEGVKVAVLDTGIDYKHPDLKDSYKGGYDFVDNDEDPMETTYEDWLSSGAFEQLYGSYYYTSHGTHVSGTIAANPKNDVEYAMTGVAPNVDLYVYRVLGPYGRGETSDIIAGIEYSVEQGMDVINLSLGSLYNTSLDVTAVAINNVAKLGVVPCVAAGNSGEGVGTMSSPGTSPLAITVGASTIPTDMPNIDFKLGNVTVNANLIASNFGDDEKELSNKEYELVDVGAGDGIWSKDVAGKVVIARYSYMSIGQIMAFSKQAGAVATIICNSEDTDFPYFLGEDANYIPTFTLTKSEGNALISELNKNPKTKLSIGEIIENIVPGDYLASFSSRGPVLNNYDIKPDVIAPGVNIVSTYPGFMNSRYADEVDYTKAYYSSNGTSMATPHVAGIAALILQANPGYSVADVKAALANTAEEMASEYNIFESGAGRVNAYEAVHSDNLVQVMDKVKTLDENGEIIEIDNIAPSLRFGQVYESGSDEAVTLEMLISNFSDSDESYDISVEFLTLVNSAGTVLDPVSNGVTLEIPETITVAANQQTSLDATINIPTIASQGLYQGYVHFVNSDNSEEAFKVPFAVRHSEKGFDYVKTSRFAAANDEDGTHPDSSSRVSAIFKLNSPMKTMDIVLSELDGGPIGFIALLDMTNTAFDIQYLLNGFFDGKYLPILSSTELGEPTLVPEGEYKISFVATGVDGEVYEIAYPLIIDNQKPVITFDENSNPDLYEITEEDLTVETDSNGVEYEGLWFHGNIYDSTIERLRELGYEVDSRGKPIDQSLNTISLQKNYNYTKNIVKPNASGDFKFVIRMDELKDMPLDIKLSYYDYATAGSLTPEVIFIARDDQPYTNVTYNKDGVKLNETITSTVSINNAKDFVKGTFKLDIRSQNFEHNVKLSDDFLAAVEAAGGTAKLEKQSSYWTVYNVIVEGAALTGDLDILEIEAKVISDKYWDGKISFVEDKSVTYENAQSGTTTLRTYSKGFDLISKTSMLMVDVACGEGLKYDYERAGAKAWLEDKSGKKYNPTRINYVGMAQIENIPAEEEYTLYIDIPGHFSYSTPISMHELNANGEKVGIYKMWFPGKIAAGDINKDNVIDINDALYIVDNYLTNNREADINYDYIVSNYDIWYVINNYGLKNPNVDTAPEPMLESDGIVLEDIIADLQDETTNLRLKLLIDKVKGLDEKAYTEETWANVKKALDNGIVVSENVEATQQQINEARVALEEAFNSLVKVVFKTHLQLAVGEAEKITEDELDKVVPAVAKEFKEALEEAKKILDDKNSTQEDVDNSWTRLASVMHMLSFYKGDKASLIALSDKISKLNGEEFFAAPWNKLQEVLAEAKVIVDDENAMEKEVNEIYEKLMRAFLDLRLLPNKDKLQELINKAESFKMELYTEESWGGLVRALSSAKEVLNNREAEKEVVQKAEDNLKLAMANLKEKTNTNNNGNGDNNSNGNSQNNGNGVATGNGSGQTNGNNKGDGNKAETKLPKTGAVVGAGFLAMVGAITSIAGIVIYKRKKTA